MKPTHWRHTMRTSILLLAAALLLPTAASAYDEVAVEGGGAITGKVTISGAPPAPLKMTITKDPDVCGSGTREVDGVKVGSGNSLPEAIVFIEGISSGKGWSTVSWDKEMDQKDCRFLPKTRVVRKSTSLRVKNEDKVFHNIHAYELIGKSRVSMFNEGQQPGTDFSKNMRMRKKDSHTIKLECDAHDFMHEHLFVADTPYFATVGEDGSFNITDVPAGTYAVKSWHPVLKYQEGSVTVSAGGSAKVDFSYKGN